MTYLIAFVRLDRHNKAYPMNCDRADIGVGDQVLIRMPESSRKLRTGTVDRLEHLGWECRNSVLCQAYEAVYTVTGHYRIERPNPLAREVYSSDHLERDLRLMRWRSGRPAATTYRRVYWHKRETTTALILFRRRGVDLQILEGASGPEHHPDGSLCIRTTVGRFVRNYFYMSRININEHALRFARRFVAGEADLGRYFQSQGRKMPKVQRPRDELSEIRDAVAHEEGAPAYLGDGVWL